MSANRRGPPRVSRGWPSTRLGWWAVALAAVFEAFMLVNGAVLMRVPEQATWRKNVLVFVGIAMLCCGLASGIVAAVALAGRQERSWLVWLPVLAGLFVVVLVAGEILVPH